MKTKELSIIIVNYNGKKYLKDCLDSIYEKCSKMDFEIVVIDNNSSDDSIGFIKANYNEVILIESQENFGFAKGNNKAVKYANGEYILLLNNDTVLLDDIAPAINALKKNENVGAVGIKMLDGNKNYSLSVGNFPNPFSLVRFSIFQKKEADFVSGNFRESTYNVDWITGAFLLTKKEYWSSINGLDEDYFMYVEDVDFCKKIQNLDKQIVFLPTVSYVHYVGFNPKREYKLITGYKIYAKKHFNFFGNIIAQSALAINYSYKKFIKRV